MEKGLKYDIKRVDTKTNDIYVSNLKVCGKTKNFNGSFTRESDVSLISAFLYKEK
jgi:thiamine pyrophosphokinase